jgi:hypothetical protein
MSLLIGELMLIDTLNDLLETTRGKKGRLTIEILEFNHRIAKEMLKASERHELLEYLGMKVYGDKAAHSDSTKGKV